MEIEKPPVFKHWSAWYWLVLGFMLLQVIAYWSLTNYFS
jgi:hypothetical protein